MNFSTTPKSISKEILRLCAELVENPSPVFVSHLPSSDAIKNECYNNVAEYSKLFGGSICYGWQIWEWPRVFIEAEFHAVWKNESGVLRDLTPKDIKLSRILFLPDHNRVYDGKQVNNVRRALTNDIDVTKFIQASEDEYKILNRGERAKQTGEIVFEGLEAIEYNNIMKRKYFAQANIVRRYPPQKNDPCPCGSGDKYKRCHGK